MGKRKGQLVLLACLLLCLSFGASVSASVAIPFDVRPQLQLMKLPTNGGELVPMGTYIANGTCAVTGLGGGRVRFSGETNCYRICDTVTCQVFLYKKKSGGDWSYVTETSLVTKSNTSSASASKETSATTGYYYHAEGGHTAKKGSTGESMTSVSGSVYIG